MKTTPTEDGPTEMERRHALRRKFNGKIEIEWGSSVLPGIVRDIGPRGLFIEIALPLWLGAAFMARLIIPPAVSLECTVNRVEPGKGMAVTFAIPEEGDKARLEALLASLPTT